MTPIRKFRSVEEMEGNTWRNPGDPDLFIAIRLTWELARKTMRPAFPPGLYRHRSLEDAEALRKVWERENFESYHARLAGPNDEPPVGSRA